MLYIADELFFAGTAAEVTPIRSVDKIQVGAGRRGPITTALQQAFFDYVNGVVPDRHGWLLPVEIPAAATPRDTRRRRSAEVLPITGLREPASAGHLRVVSRRCSRPASADPSSVADPAG